MNHAKRKVKRSHSVSIELRSKNSQKLVKGLVEERLGPPTTGQASPRYHSPSDGRAEAALQGTGFQSLDVTKGTGWWTSCVGQSVAAQPLET